MLPPGADAAMPDGVSDAMSVKPNFVSSMACMTPSATAGSSEAPYSPNVLTLRCPPNTDR